MEILQKLRPPTASEEFFRNYISLVLSVFYLATRDLAELMHQVCVYYLFCCLIYLLVNAMIYTLHCQQIGIL